MHKKGGAVDERQAKQLGDYLRQARRAAELSAVQLAEKSGVSDATIIRIENGQYRTPQAESLAQMAHALDLSVHDVFERAGYLSNDDLPTFTPYLRTKYGELPDEAVEQIERYVTRIAKKHGIDMSGPKPGQDESP